MDVEPNPGAVRFELNDLLTFLREQKVQPLPDLSWRVEQAQNKAGPGPLRLERFHVAQGRLPAAGGDGRLEWAINFEERLPARTSGDDRVDFHQGHGQGLRNIRKDERILSVVDPEPGVPGATIFGDPVPAQPGKPFALRAGANVRAEDGGRAFTAGADGHVLLEGDVLIVSPQFDVKENVDFTVGNLDFYGSVRVMMNVLDGFTVRAARGIWVGGIVESAHLDSGAGIELAGGVAGKGKATLRAQGGITAKYINSADVECPGDVNVASELVNAKVRTKGKISLPNGRIVGGEVIAAKGVVVRQLGAPGGEVTTVIVGVDFEAEQRQKEIRTLLPELQRRARVLTENVTPYLADPNRLKGLSPDRLGQVRQMILELKDLRTQVKGMEDENNSTRMLHNPAHAGERESIIVLRRLHPGVTVQIGTCRTQYNSEVEGPVRLVPHLETGTVRAEPYRP